jgi:hypothetical protein
MARALLDASRMRAMMFTLGLAALLAAAPGCAQTGTPGAGSRILDPSANAGTRGPENPTVPGGGQPGMDDARLRGERPDPAPSTTRSTFPPAGASGDHVGADATPPAGTRGYEGAPER